MWETLGQIAMVVAAVWTIAALAARSARKEEQLKKAERESQENAKIDKIIHQSSTLDRDACLERLRDHKNE